MLLQRLITAYVLSLTLARRMNNWLCNLRWRCLLAFGIYFLFASGLSLFSKSPDNHSKIDFNRDIRPIFSDHCYACHGPDEQKRKAGLRLDVEEEAFKELKSGNHALVAGNTVKSALVARITSADLARGAGVSITGALRHRFSAWRLERRAPQGDQGSGPVQRERPAGH